MQSRKYRNATQQTYIVTSHVKCIVRSQPGNVIQLTNANTGEDYGLFSPTDTMYRNPGLVIIRPKSYDILTTTDILKLESGDVVWLWEETM